ncbi:hypothetical protein GN244_ATG13469 [Phytophthora infestans]|uniref:Uncharacterized protein n=1 Tax=Phytophthora infestans TaxID=4787 RepID=A0A833W9B9_PHYIN|nr:hypothetical protein GN244_ATG13469 [Phytophthora infestans]
MQMDPEVLSTAPAVVGDADGTTLSPVAPDGSSQCLPRPVYHQLLLLHRSAARRTHLGVLACNTFYTASRQADDDIEYRYTRFGQWLYRWVAMLREVDHGDPDDVTELGEDKRAVVLNTET